MWFAFITAAAAKIDRILLYVCMYVLSTKFFLNGFAFFLVHDIPTTHYKIKIEKVYINKRGFFPICYFLFVHTGMYVVNIYLDGQEVPSVPYRLYVYHVRSTSGHKCSWKLSCRRHISDYGVCMYVSYVHWLVLFARGGTNHTIPPRYGMESAVYRTSSAEGATPR